MESSPIFEWSLAVRSHHPSILLFVSNFSRAKQYSTGRTLILWLRERAIIYNREISMWKYSSSIRYTALHGYRILSIHAFKLILQWLIAFGVDVSKVTVRLLDCTWIMTTSVPVSYYKTGSIFFEKPSFNSTLGCPETFGSYITGKWFSPTPWTLSRTVAAVVWNVCNTVDDDGDRDQWNSFTR